MSVDKEASYYDAGGIETIAIIKAKLTPEQFVGFCLGNALKYLCRYNFKHDSTGMERDRIKANTYLKMLEPEDCAEIKNAGIR